MAVKFQMIFSLNIQYFSIYDFRFNWCERLGQLMEDLAEFKESVTLDDVPRDKLMEAF